MKFKRIIFISALILAALFVIILFFILFFNAFHQTADIRANDTAKLSECVKNQDCVKVQTTCCSCNMGGVDKCVSFTLAKLYQNNLNACPNPEKLICAAFYNCNIQSCACVNGTCVSN